MNNKISDSLYRVTGQSSVNSATIGMIGSDDRHKQHTGVRHQVTRAQVVQRCTLSAVTRAQGVLTQSPSSNWSVH